MRNACAARVSMTIRVPRLALGIALIVWTLVSVASAQSTPVETVTLPSGTVFTGRVVSALPGGGVTPPVVIPASPEGSGTTNIPLDRH